MKLTKKQVEHIATLARLRVTEAEAAAYSEQLSGILDYVEKLQQVDVAGVEETSQVTGLTSIMRTDEVMPSGIESDLVATAPSQGNGYIKIPKVFKHK